MAIVIAPWRLLLIAVALLGMILVAVAREFIDEVRTLVLVRLTASGGGFKKVSAVHILTLVLRALHIFLTSEQNESSSNAEHVLRIMYCASGGMKRNFMQVSDIDRMRCGLCYAPRVPI